MSESLGSEIHIPTGKGIIRDTRIDESTGATTFGYGYCSGCRKSLSPTDWALCSKGDLACKDHVIQFETAAFCKPHFVSEIISKRACKIAFCIAMGFKPDKAGKLARMNEKDVGAALDELRGRKYLVITNCWPWKKYELTDMGYAAMRTGAFRDEPDFESMMRKIGRDFDGS